LNEHILDKVMNPIMNQPIV